jgi:pheromone a factor receptor
MTSVEAVAWKNSKMPGPTTNMDTLIANGTSAPLSMAIALIVFSASALVILVVPALWHWKVRNVGACSLIFHLTLGNLCTFINAIIWPNENYASWWNGVGLCDIENNIKWPYITGVTCATACITRNLAVVLDVDRSELNTTIARKHRKMLLELAFCFAIPVLQIPLHYVVQDNRYFIQAIGGCGPVFDQSWPSIVIMYIWPLLFSLLNCYYACKYPIESHGAVTDKNI